MCYKCLQYHTEYRRLYILNVLYSSAAPGLGLSNFWVIYKLYMMCVKLSALFFSKICIIFFPTSFTVYNRYSIIISILWRNNINKMKRSWSKYIHVRSQKSVLLPVVYTQQVAVLWCLCAVTGIGHLQENARNNRYVN